MTYEDAEADIQAHIDSPGAYSHNIISITLRKVEETLGRAAANRLVEGLDLEGHFGIQPVELEGGS